MSRYRGTHDTAITRDQNPHNPMMGVPAPGAQTEVAAGEGRRYFAGVLGTAALVLGQPKIFPYWAIRQAGSHEERTPASNR